MSREEQMRKQAVDFLKNWALPGMAVVVSFTAAWTRMEGIAAQHESKIEALRHDIDRLHAVGSDGLLDPSAHGAMDCHCRHYLEQLLGNRGFRRFVNQYADSELDR